MTETQADRLLRIIRRRGIIKSSELARLGIARKYLSTLENEGLLVKQGRGTYALSDLNITERSSLALACKAVPSGVICLLSALQFHNIGTQLPTSVWLAIPTRSHRPEVSYPPLNLCEFSKSMHDNGIERYFENKVEIRVYGKAKTIVDCFRYRNKIGLDVCIEALKDYLIKSDASIDELMHYAAMCRTSKIILPYIEALK